LQIRASGGIRAYQEGINNRVLLEKEISGVQQEIFNIEGELVNNVINNDSISLATVEVVNYFYSKPALVKSDYLQLFTLQNSLGNFDDASETLNNLRSYASSLNSTEADEIYRYCDVTEIYLTFIDSVSDLSVLMNNKQFLLESALASSADYSAMAEVLYSFTTDSIFLEYTPLPTEIMAPRNTVINENIVENETFSYNVYPVPAKEMIFVEYNFEENYSEATELLNKTIGKVKDENCNFGIIKLYSTEGKLINTYALSSVSGKETISISDLKPGNYILEIEDCFGNTRSSKITKF
jgi:hypothetical protein